MTQEALNKFKAIYLSEFGIELLDKEALELATNFLNLMREVVQPIKDKNE